MEFVQEHWQLLSLLSLSLFSKLFSGALLDALIRGIDLATTNDTSRPFRERKTYTRFSSFLASLVIYAGFSNYYSGEIDFEIVEVVLALLMTLTTTRLLFSLLDVVDDLYQYKKTANEIPISGFLQALKVILAIGAIVIIISLIVGQPPGYLLGSAAAIIGLIAIGIKDTILGFVNGFQVVANRIISVGDWLEAPAFKADGNVKRIGLNVITVQNWDKTYSIIPTHAVMNTPIKNWKGMSKSGVRKIQRYINIDQKSIRALTNKDIEKMPASVAIAIEQSSWQGKTNVTVFRGWIKDYLSRHTKISDSETLLVRTKQPTPEGLPLEIYCFCTDNQWVPFEEIQSEILETILDVAKHFRIAIYQRVSDYTEGV